MRISASQQQALIALLQLTVDLNKSPTNVCRERVRNILCPALKCVTRIERKQEM